MNNKILIALTAISLTSATHAMDPTKQAKTDAFVSRVAGGVTKEMKATLIPELVRALPKPKGRFFPVTFALTTGLVLGGLVEQQNPGTTKAVTTWTHTQAGRAVTFLSESPWSVHEAAVSEEKTKKASSEPKASLEATPVPFNEDE